MQQIHLPKVKARTVVIKMSELNDFRCGGCNSMLAKTDGNTEIVCRKCHGKNIYDPKTGKVKFIKEIKKPERTSSSGCRFY